MQFRILVIALTLLFITSCADSELDRCVIANLEKLDPNDFSSGDYADYSDYMEVFEDVSDEQFSKLLQQLESKGCDSDPFLPASETTKRCQAIADSLFAEYEAKADDLANARIEKELEDKMEQAATNLCNAQGIY